MKKTIRTILYAAAFAVLAVSCQKEIDGAEPVANTKETIEISINGLMGEYTPVDATKASLVNNVRVSWEGGETVFVYDGTQCLGKLIASLDANGDDRYALLSTDTEHTVSKPVDGTKYLTLVYSPLLSAAPDVKEGAISISLAEQNSTKAPFVAYATLDYTGTTITDALVPFRFATSVIKVNCCGLKANTAIDNATLSNVNTACKLTLSGTATPSVAGDVSGNIIRTEDTYFAVGKVNSEGEAVFQIAVPVLSAGTRSLTILQGTSIFEDNNFSQSALSTATSVNTVCQLAERPVAPEGGLTGKFTVNSTGRQVYFSRGNLQATSQGDDSYTWDFADHQYDVVGGTDYSGAGSATGNNTIGSQTKGAKVDLFGWSTGKTYYGISTSKNNDDYSGDFEDWGTTIDTYDTWRTLSRNEWSYLLGDNPIRKGKSKIAVQVCGIKGLVLAPDNYTGTIQDSYDEAGWLAAEEAGMVFLPAAGTRYTTDAGASVVGNLSEYGYYWSSTVSDLGSPFMLLFSNSSYGGGAGYIEPDNSDNPSSGRSVRLVSDVAGTGSDGSLTGLFSVRAGKQVYFSRGNLQATFQGNSYYTWDFAEHQYDVVGGTDYNGKGTATGNNTIDSQSKGAKVDLFGWSTGKTYYGISTLGDNDKYSGNFVDWGNIIDDKGTWRTLTHEEWAYLVGNSQRRKGKSKVAVQVCGVKGLVIAPDNYTGSIQDSYDEAGWPAAEEAGMVFLPAAGMRNNKEGVGPVVGNLDAYGYYWSSTASENGSSYMLLFANSSYGGGAGYIKSDNSDNPSSGRSVRLVKDKR